MSTDYQQLVIVSKKKICENLFIIAFIDGWKRKIRARI